MAISTSDPLLPSTALGWLPMIGMVLGVQIGSHGLMAHAMRGLPASYASVTALARRVLAGVGARPLFGETMAQSQIVGAALVLGGLALAARRPVACQSTGTDQWAVPVLRIRRPPAPGRAG